ncbi:MAG TPA: hypothetical protein VF772_26210 [Terriglobales bacterium]
MNPSSVIGAYSPPNPARNKQSKPFVHQHGMGHQTPAHRTMLANALGQKSGGKKKARGHRVKAHVTKTGVKVRGHVAKQRAGAKHLKKGSLAAKRHMSSLRKMRKAKTSG